MRVGDSSLFQTFLRYLQRNKTIVGEGVRKLSDGKEVRKASDDPAGARSSLTLRGRLVRIQGVQRSGERARFDLSTIDQTLGQAIGMVTQARTLAMAGASETTVDGNPNRAVEVGHIREEVLSLANTYQDGRYLFGGTETLTVPFNPDGTYNGNSDTVKAPVDAGQEVEATVDGGAAFQGPSDLFQLLDDLETALQANDSATIQSLIPQFTEQIDYLGQLRSGVGVQMNRVDDFASRQEDEKLRLLTRISEIEDAPLDEVIFELTAAQTTTQALSATAAKTLGRSLFDFIG